MGKSSKTGRQLSPLELGVIVVFILGAFLFEWINGGPGASPTPIETAVVETSSPAAPAARQAAATSTLSASTTVPTGKPSPTRAAAPTQPAADTFGAFDYFVLSLSWAPDYCAANGSNDPQECGLGKKLGFVLHGLWPQYNQGYPSSCGSEALPAAVKAKFPGLYPNDSLAEHEWAKHGTCSGLPPERYLAYTRQIKDSVAIPPALRAPQSPVRTTSADLKDQFIQVNSGFSPTDLAVNCSSSGRYLSEVYVCFDKGGQPAACGADVQKSAAKSCNQADFLVRNTR